MFVSSKQWPLCNPYPDLFSFWRQSRVVQPPHNPHLPKVLDIFNRGKIGRVNFLDFCIFFMGHRLIEDVLKEHTELILLLPVVISYFNGTITKLHSAV